MTPRSHDLGEPFGPPWSERIDCLLDRSLALAVGVFGVDGEQRYLNRGMRALLGGEAPPSDRLTYLVNPTFQTLRDGSDSEVFRGLLTYGDRHRESRSLQTAVWRLGDELLIASEFDVLELNRVNGALSRSNQEINNLQRDLIKQKRMLEATLAELRRTEAMLIHAEKMNALGQLVAGVAHEINNPLSYITGNVQSLEEDVADLRAGYAELERIASARGAGADADATRNRHQIDTAEDELAALFPATFDGLRRINTIIDHLCRFSRLHEGERKSVDLRANLTSTLAIAAPQLREKQIQVLLELPEPTPIECDPAELNQVFLNLIVNAVQAMKTGGTLRIGGAVGADGWLRIDVCDDGQGVPAEARPRVFEPFFTTKPVGGGTGLGLSIAHQIITERHGGRISLESKPGHGTCVHIELPLHLPASNREEAVRE